MNQISEFQWEKELEKTVAQTLATSFGLDFLLFKDKHGGEVDTVHNVRQGIYATEREGRKYENRGGYKSSEYHSHPDYIDRGRADKASQNEGSLVDAYRGKKMSQNDNRDLDHVISAKEIHHDPGRVLAGISGPELSNTESNLSSTHETINRSKQDKAVEKFVSGIDASVANKKMELQKKRDRLASMPRDTPKQRHEADKIESEIRKNEKMIATLESVDKEAMLEKDAKARKEYDGTINKEYYSSSKFLESAGGAAAISGIKMGMRQMLGLVLAEVWFEMRQTIPELLDRLKSGFNMEKFLEAARGSLEGIWERINKRFEYFIEKFRDGLVSGIVSSITTTMFNIIFTTQKMMIKLVREMWSSLVQAFKMLAFNPDDLSTVDLIVAVSNVLALGVSTVLGTMIYAQILPVVSGVPFGAEIAAFISALSTGLIALGFQYFIIHSPIMKRLWNDLHGASHALTLEQFRNANAKLDAYLVELARIEFGFDAWEMHDFTQSLAQKNDEFERSVVLRARIRDRDIALPFEAGNSASTIKWIANEIKNE